MASTDISAMEKATQGKVVGVIIPPPDIRAVVDKTAQFVAKNGKSFEQRILASNEAKSAKFNFMKEFDPYHAYYEFKIREAEEAIAAGKDPAVQQAAPKPAEKAPYAPSQAQVQQPVKPQASRSARAAIVNPIAKLAKDTPSTPPYNLDFAIMHPSGVNTLEMDIIKLTAQFTAVNGREFLAALAQREQRNQLFDFLKPTHLLFSYFTSLVDSYAKIVHPTAELQERVYSRTNKNKVYEHAVHRWGWTRAESERKREAEMKEKEEKLAFQAIDWNEFVVVEVIDFPEDELFDLPGLNAAIPSANDKKSATSALPPAPPAPPAAPSITVGKVQPPPAPPAPAAPMDIENEDEDDGDKIKVVNNYQPRLASNLNNPSNNTTTIDPITGKAIPLNQLEEHMRISLLDPKWKEEQKRFLDKQKETGYAEGTSIAESLKLFAKKRGDIFGQSTTTPVTNSLGSDNLSAKEIADQEAFEQAKYAEASNVTWDGFYGSVAATQKMKADAPTSLYNMPTNINIGPSPVLPPPPPALDMRPPPPPMPASYSSMGAPPPPPMPAVNYNPYDMSMGMPGMPSMPAPPMPGIPPPVPPIPVPPVISSYSTTYPDESKAKKPRLDSTALLPAEEFAAMYPGPCSIEITLPNDPTSNSKFVGNTLTISLPLGVQTTIKEMKELLSSSYLDGFPVNKIQLKHAIHGFIKDTNNLASMNLASNSLLELSIKTRGGKK